MKKYMQKLGACAVMLGASVMTAAAQATLTTELEGVSDAIAADLALLRPVIVVVAAAAVGYWFLKFAMPQVISVFSSIGKKR